MTQTMIFARERRLTLSKRSYLVIAATLLLIAVAMFIVLPRTGQSSQNEGTAPLYTVGFADAYDLIANNIVTGRGFKFEPYMGETMMREPGYPLLLALSFKIGGDQLSSAQWLNWFLTIGIAILLLRLAWMVTGDETAAVVATIIALLYPGTLIAEARGGVEILFIFVLLVFLHLLYKAIATSALWRFLIAGLALGIVVQVRSTPMVFPPFLLLYLIVIVRDWRLRFRAVINVAALCAGMLLVMTPWMVRNFRLVHHLVPTATVQGVAMQEGQYTCKTLPGGGEFYALQREAGLQRASLARQSGFPFEGVYYYQFFFNPKDEWTFNQELLARAKREYSLHPSFLGYCACRNVINFWFLGKTARSTRINEFVQTPLLLLTAWGLYLLWTRGQMSRMWVILLLAFCVMAVSLPIIAHARHSVPLVPILAIPSSVSLLSIWTRFARVFQHRAAQSEEEVVAEMRSRN